MYLQGVSWSPNEFSAGYATLRLISTKWATLALARSCIRLMAESDQIGSVPLYGCLDDLFNFPEIGGHLP